MFKVGQEVVCIKKTKWRIVRGCDGDTPPKYGDINTIEYLEDLEGEVYLNFVGIYGAWHHSAFRPIDYDFVEEVIKQVEPKEELV